MPRSSDTDGTTDTVAPADAPTAPPRDAAHAATVAPADAPTSPPRDAAHAATVPPADAPTSLPRDAAYAATVAPADAPTSPPRDAAFAPTVAPGVDDAHAPTVTPAYAESDHQPRRAVDLTIVDRKHYDILDEFGRGGLGRVLRARDRRSGRIVAIKEALRASPGLLARFAREALVTANLQHPSIVPVYEIKTRARRWPAP